MSSSTCSGRWVNYGNSLKTVLINYDYRTKCDWRPLSIFQAWAHQVDIYNFFQPSQRSNVERVLSINFNLINCCGPCTSSSTRHSLHCEPWKLFILLLFPTFIVVQRPSGKAGKTPSRCALLTTAEKFIKKNLEKFFMISKNILNVEIKQCNWESSRTKRRFRVKRGVRCIKSFSTSCRCSSWGEQNATSCEHWMPKWGKTEAEIKLFYDERKAACCRLTFHHSAAHS